MSLPTPANLPPGISLADVAQLLRMDLENRWQAGDRAAVEGFIARLPTSDPELIVDLIFAEYLIRERLGERPEPDEYARRFPAVGSTIRDQISLHLALNADPLTP